MALGNTSKVLVGIPDSVGGLWVHQDGVIAASELPTADTKLAEAGFVNVGFISEDGVTETSERDTDKIKAWGGDTIRVVQNEHTQTFSMTLSEAANVDVLRLVYGEENVEKAGDKITIKQNAKILPHLTWVMEVLDGENKVRKVIADAQITETSDITWVHSDVVKFEITIECFPDDEGNKVYTYITLAAASGEGDTTEPSAGE